MQRRLDQMMVVNTVTLEQDRSNPTCPVDFSTLSPQQLQCLDDVVYKKKNVFLTGGGGVGKSHVVKVISQLLEWKGVNYALTATTGVAAVTVGGCTIHSYSGLGTGTASVQTYVKRLSQEPYATKWNKLQLLIIDEISMLHPDFFRKLDTCVSEVRGRPRQRFGGLQVLLVGDFFQLPPVWKANDGDADNQFVFETRVWRDSITTVHHLETIFRQQNDSRFQELLLKLRHAELTAEDMTYLKSLSRPLNLPNGIKPTRLYSTNKVVDEMNQRMMNNLGGNVASYDISVRYVEKVKSGLPITGTEQTRRNKLKQTARQQCPAGDVVKLKLGAQVMLTYNLDVAAGLCNGSRGVVMSMEGGYPVVQFVSGPKVKVTPHAWTYRDPDEYKNYVEMTQIPLRLAWAITIHRSQSMTLDALECDLGNCFTPGQAYVALSRGRSLDTVCIKNIKDDSIFTHPKVVEFYKTLA